MTTTTPDTSTQKITTTNVNITSGANTQSSQPESPEITAAKARVAEDERAVEKANSWLLILLGIYLVSNLLVLASNFGIVGVTYWTYRVNKRLRNSDSVVASLYQERAAHAESELFKLRAPRYIFLVRSLANLLKDKPTGSFSIIFAPENVEARDTANWLEGILSADGKWTLLANARPYSETDVIPRWAGVPKKAYLSLFERVGGSPADVTLVISPADFENSKVWIREGTATHALYFGIIACGLEPSFNFDERLPSGTVRLIIGPRR